MYPRILVDGSISLAFVDMPMEEELRQLILKNKTRILPWFWWMVGKGESTNIAQFIDTYRKDLAQDKSISFVIFWENKIVGIIDIYDIITAYEYSARLGYWLDIDATGKGIMTKSIDKVVEYLNWRYGIRRVEILASPENIDSCKVAERCGFEKEGVRRAAFGFEGKFEDLAVYGLLL